MNRGEIWWVNLPEPKGSSPGYKRPMLIIQADSFNQSRINTVICAVITSNLKLAQAPGNILLPQKSSGLSKDSVINISQIVTVDKAFLEEKVGEITRKQRMKLDGSLRIVLQISD